MGKATFRICALALLALSDTLFLWMFLSSDPLEQLAACSAGLHEPVANAAFRFAAEWRHGMTGDAWVYMPGFFATAAALWVHARHAPAGRARVERVMAALAALGAAAAGAPAGSELVVRRFAQVSGIHFQGALPPPSSAAALSGLYTLLTWSVFILSCRRALMGRTLRPFIAPAVLAIGLAVFRPWTVDDFTTLWLAGIGAGDIVARVSLALVFVVAVLLAASEHRSAEPEPAETALADG